MVKVSGYGRIAVVPPVNTELTSVGAGTPMGEVLRRYWQPVCVSADVDELPKAVRILNEELVAFRDLKGRVGVLDAHCAHCGEVAYAGAEEFDKQVRDEDQVFRALVKDFGLVPATK